jgi:uncharacterized membrane protein YbhN (UPF0104 family)
VIFMLVSAGIVAFLLYYLYHNADQYIRLLRLSVVGVISILMLSLLSAVVGGLLNVYMFASLNAKLSYRDAFHLGTSSTLANQLPIPAGMIARGFYLKRQHNLSYAKYFSATLALYFCMLALNGFIGLTILLHWTLSSHQTFSPMLWGAFGAMAASLTVFALPIERIKFWGFLRRWVAQALEGWTLISTNRVLLLKLLGLQTGLMLSWCVRYWLAFHMLSQNVTFGQTLLFATASVLTQLVTFAPAGVGVRESIVGAVSLALGFPLAASVAAVGLDRLISTTTIFLLGWIGSMALGRQLANATKEGAEAQPRNL